MIKWGTEQEQQGQSAREWKKGREGREDNDRRM